MMAYDLFNKALMEHRRDFKPIIKIVGKSGHGMSYAGLALAWKMDNFLREK